MRRVISDVVAVSALSALVGLGVVGAGDIASAAETGKDNPANWPIYNRTLDGTRFSPLKEITAANVQNLQVAWIAQTGDITLGLQETPLVIDGVVYSIAANDRVQAFDGETGQEIWHYFPKLNDVVN